jgi:hypoxanthine-guanine phosphoribosyltransferase
VAYFRAQWQNFPDVVICNDDEKIVRSYPTYAAAKSGDHDAARELVDRFITHEFLEQVRGCLVRESRPIVAAVHAEEEFGRNQIAAVMAGRLATLLGLEAETSVLQSNIVNHTKASGWAKLARQAEFDGEVTAGASYLLVDDFVGQGGTLANFRGHFLNGGASVVGACVLTGKEYSAKLALSNEQITELVARHGPQIEVFCQSAFGFGYDCLTKSEARWLAKAESLDAIRAELAAVG